MTQLWSPVTRNRIAALLEQDLSFNEGRRYLIHSIHSFAAKFPPQLPRYFIEGLTSPGDTVLDPMSGSGVTILEAWLLRRRAIGIDLDPLAVLLGRVRTTSYDLPLLIETGTGIIERAQSLLTSKEVEEFVSGFDNATLKFINYWFLPETQKELAALSLAIRSEANQVSREFFAWLLSSIIVTKSGGVTLARDLAHSRPHKVKDKTPKQALVTFKLQFQKSLKALQEIQVISKGVSEVESGDCRNLALPSESIDLIVTSPPYANALDYMRAHKFSLVWLGKNITELGLLRSQYIGSENCSSLNEVQLPSDIEDIIARMEKLDSRKSKVLYKYFCDMRLALKEMYRVLKPDCAAIVVVGSSTMRGLQIDTPGYLGSISSELGFEVVNIVQRPIDRNRRMMPVAAGARNLDSIIEQRMHQESVIGLLKG